MLERKQTGMCVRAASFVRKSELRSLCLLDCEEANKSKCSIGVELPRRSKQSGLDFLLDQKFLQPPGEVTCHINKSLPVPSCQNLGNKFFFYYSYYYKLLFFEIFSQERIFIFSQYSFQNTENFNCDLIFLILI